LGAARAPGRSAPILNSSRGGAQAEITIHRHGRAASEDNCRHDQEKLKDHCASSLKCMTAMIRTIIDTRELPGRRLSALSQNDATCRVNAVKRSQNEKKNDTPWRVSNRASLGPYVLRNESENAEGQPICTWLLPLAIGSNVSSPAHIETTDQAPRGLRRLPKRMIAMRWARA